MPLYSTGCASQGQINAELIAQPHGSAFSISGTPTGKPKKPANTTLTPFPPLSYLRTLPRPLLGSVPYGEVITTCSVPGTLALTFDDGPWRYTSDLLDLLGREGARATFFVCGGNMAGDQMTGYGHPQLLRRMLTDGHQVGSHTWAHPDLAAVPDAEAMRQMWLNERALVGVLGLLPTYFRPPYLSWGGATLGVMAALGYHVASVDVDTRDWAGDYDAARRTFLDALAQGAGGGGKIVLAHDIREQTVHELAEFMIREATERGYELVTLGECLGDGRENWYRNPYDGGSWERGKYRFHGNDLDERRADPAEAEAPSAHRLHYHTVPPAPPGFAHRETVPRPVESERAPLDGTTDLFGYLATKNDQPLLEPMPHRPTTHPYFILPKKDGGPVDEEERQRNSTGKITSAGDLRVSKSTSAMLLALMALFFLCR